MNKLILAAFAAALATPALAQPIDRPAVPPPGAPGVVSTQSNSTGAEGAMNYSPTGRPADVISNDSSAAGNAGQPSRVAPQGGGGGGGR